MSVTAAAQQPHVFQTNDHLSVDIGWRAAEAKPREQGAGNEIGMFAEEEPSFWDLVDIINPLQHIPVVNTLYREITGDEIGYAARLAGGALFGGPVGLVAAVVNSAIEEDTGKDIGGHVLALFDGEADADTPDAPDTGIAAQASAEPAPAAAADVPAATETPVIAAASQPQPGAMMFTVAGPVGSPEAVAATPTAPPQALVGTAAPARFFPLPPRTAIQAVRETPPMVTVPVSSSGNRSNVPITGRTAVVPPPVVSNASAVDGMAPDPAAAQWFGSAMKSGLDKYEQAARLGKRGDPREVIPLQ